MSRKPSGTAKRTQTHCARCGKKFASPGETRGSGYRVCEECLEEDAL